MPGSSYIGTSRAAHLEENIATAWLELGAEDWAELESVASAQVGTGRKRRKMIAPSENACTGASNHPLLSVSKGFNAPARIGPR
jgi:hypothetical protein